MVSEVVKRLFDAQERRTAGSEIRLSNVEYNGASVTDVHNSFFFNRFIERNEQLVYRGPDSLLEDGNIVLRRREFNLAEEDTERSEYSPDWSIDDLYRVVETEVTPEFHRVTLDQDTLRYSVDFSYTVNVGETMLSDHDRQRQEWFEEHTDENSPNLDNVDATFAGTVKGYVPDVEGARIIAEKRYLDDHEQLELV